MAWQISASVDVVWTSNAGDPARVGQLLPTGQTVIVPYLGQFSCVPDPAQATPATVVVTATHLAGTSDVASQEADFQA